MSKFRNSQSQATTEYQETILDPNLGEASQVQCAKCGSWRANSRLYCPSCGERNVLSQSTFLTEEQLIAQAKEAEELKASIREPAKDKQRTRQYMLLALFALTLVGGFIWAYMAREEAQETKERNLIAAAQKAEQEKQKALELAAEKERAATVAAEAALRAASEAAAAVAAQAAASAAAAILNDEQATKLGLNTPLPKRKLSAASAPVLEQAAAIVAPVVIASAPAPEPPKPEPPPAPKVETPQEKLASALTACRNKGGFFERNACEFNARKTLCPSLEGKVRDCPVQRNDL